MEVDSMSSSSSDEEIEPEVQDAPYIHSATVRLSVGCKIKAETIAEAVRVDKEPARSGARRQVESEGEFIVIKIESKDPKSLSKSLSNAVDMIDLSLKTIEAAEKYEKRRENDLKRKLEEKSQS